MSALKNLCGQKFGRLMVISRGDNHILPSGQSQTMWNCICDCGNTVKVNTGNLKSGRIVSCGCYNQEVRCSRNHRTHGDSETRLYNTWNKMKARCLRASNPSYHRYGGRGIKVCDEWKDNFETFKDWALRSGYNDTLTLDRIDVNGDYEPTNCRWTTIKVQENNRTDNVVVKYEGKSQTLAEWAEEYGLKYTTFYRRIERGWDFEDALTIPVRKRGG